MGMIVDRLDGVDVIHQLRINFLPARGHGDAEKQEQLAEAISQETLLGISFLKASRLFALREWPGPSPAYGWPVLFLGVHRACPASSSANHVPRLHARPLFAAPSPGWIVLGSSWQTPLSPEFCCLGPRAPGCTCARQIGPADSPAHLQDSSRRPWGPSADDRRTCKRRWLAPAPATEPPGDYVSTCGQCPTARNDLPRVAYSPTWAWPSR